MYENSAYVAADQLGNVFVAGETDGNFSGGPATSSTAYLRKYDSAGNASWTRQVGPLDTSANFVAVAADGLGNSYVAGETASNIGGPNAGLSDFFVRKYDAAGNVLWTRQDGSLSYDSARDAAVDSLGNLYLVGLTGYELAGPSSSHGDYDAFLTKYDAAGNKLWTRQFGSNQADIAQGVALDGLGNVYIAGYTSGSVGGPYGGGSADMFLAKFDQNGNAAWARQVGSPSTDLAEKVAADKLGNVYLVGLTGGNIGGPSAGLDDIVVVRYDSAGNVVWTRQAGTSSTDEAWGAAVDGLGNVYVSGVTSGDLVHTNAGPYDLFTLKYMSDGTVGWGYQVGSDQSEIVGKISHDGVGNLYLTGVTEGNVGGPSAGFDDTFLVKLFDSAVVPEPATAAQLCLVAIVGFLWPRCRRRTN